MSLNFLGTGRFQQGSESQPHQFSSPKSMFRQQYVFQSDLDFNRLSRQLGVLVDVIHQVFPSVRKVTKVRTICDAMNVQDTYCACILLCLLYLQHQKELFYFETSITIHEIINDGKSFEQLHDYAHPQMYN